MSAPNLFPSAPATDSSPFLNNRSHLEVTRGDRYPEVVRGQEGLETARDYSVVDKNGFSPLREKGITDQQRTRTGDYRIFGLRPWVLVALVCVVAIAIAIAVGLAIGIPASKRKHENIDSARSASPLPSAAALTASGTTSSEPAKPTVSSTPILQALARVLSLKPQSQSSPIPSVSPSIACPANNTNIFSTFTNDDDTVHTPDQIKSQDLKYTIHCNSDYTATGKVRDVFGVTLSSLTECINQCSKFNLQLPSVDQVFENLCSGVTLVQNRCYIKQGVTEQAISKLQHDVGDSAILIWKSE